MSTKRITLADVATEAGLSKTAVSLALNDMSGSRLSADAVQRAKDAAKKLNYRPNPAARTLRTQVTESFGFLSSDIAVTSWGMAMVSGALRKSNQNDHALLISESSEDSVRQRRSLEALLDRGVDGLIVAEMRPMFLQLFQLFMPTQRVQVAQRQFFPMNTAVAAMLWPHCFRVSCAPQLQSLVGTQISRIFRKSLSLLANACEASVMS